MEPRTVLLVEDNEQLNEINRRALEGEGCEVLAAMTLAEARAHLAGRKPDVILLDVVLPDGDGIDFCGEIRGGTDAHILFLTSKSEHENRIRGLETGGDDYITKPYKLDEMLSRVRAALRRRAMEAAKPPARAITRGPLTLDLISLRAYLNSEDLSLTQKEFSLLALLVQHKNETLSKETLYEKVWGQPMARDAGALRAQISLLKKKLEDKSGGKIILMSFRGEGYSLEIEP